MKWDIWKSPTKACSQANTPQKGWPRERENLSAISLPTSTAPSGDEQQRACLLPTVGCGQQSLMEKQEFHHCPTLTKPVPLQYPSFFFFNQDSTLGERKKKRKKYPWPGISWGLVRSQNRWPSSHPTPNPLGHGGQGGGSGPPPSLAVSPPLPPPIPWWRAVTGGQTKEKIK